MALFPSGFTLSFDHWTTFWFFFSLKNKMCSITVCVYLHLKRQYRRGWSISIRWWVRMLHKPQLTFHFKLNGNNQKKKKEFRHIWKHPCVKSHSIVIQSKGVENALMYTLELTTTGSWQLVRTLSIFIRLTRYRFSSVGSCDDVGIVCLHNFLLQCLKIVFFADVVVRNAYGVWWRKQRSDQPKKKMWWLCVIARAIHTSYYDQNQNSSSSLCVIGYPKKATLIPPFNQPIIEFLACRVMFLLIRRFQHKQKKKKWGNQQHMQHKYIWFH